jgi:histidine phosphotransfer protein HptB
VVDIAEPIIDWTRFSSARSELGADFIRILGYFQEDGVKSVAAIEAGMRARSAVQLILPAHTLKGEAQQFGADALSELAEAIENIGRDSVERRQEPDEALPHVVKLRALFTETMEAFERETNPLVERRGFGRKTQANNQRFGAL